MTTPDPTTENADGAQPLVLDAFGVLVCVLPPDASTRRRWASQWSRALTDADPATAGATVDTRSTTPATNQDAADYTLSSRVTLSALEQTVGQRMSLHAAGVSDREGRVLALVAASGTGKTTAARTLGKVLGYLSDETVSVGRDLDVLPYAKPLSVVIEPERPYHKSQHSPDDLGLLAPPSGTRLHRLVVLKRDAGHGDFGLTPLSISEALTLVIPQTSHVTSFDAPLMELTSIMQAAGGPQLLTYVEIGEHVEELRALLAGPTEPAEQVVHHPGVAALPEGQGGQVARAPWHDAVEFEDAIVVLIEATSFRLDHLGATVWLALEEPMTPEGLVAAVEKEHGTHPGAVQLVADAMDVLVQHAILVRL